MDDDTPINRRQALQFISESLDDTSSPESSFTFRWLDVDDEIDFEGLDDSTSRELVAETSPTPMFLDCISLNGATGKR